MIDFALTEKGDLILEKQSSFSKFKMDFRIAAYPVFTVKFFQVPYQYVVHDNNLKITFDTEAHSKVTKHRAAFVKDKEALIQQIKIRLRTQLTELPTRQTIGSQLQLMKHERLNSATNLSRIKTMTVAAINNIVSNLEVIVKAEETTGSFYCQNVNIYIYSDGVLLCNFNI